MRTDAEYLEYDPFDDCDIDIRNRTVKIVTVRKEQWCNMAGYRNNQEQHNVPVGHRARVERAVVEGEWKSSYTCLPCLDRWLNEQLENCSSDEASE